MPKLNMTVSHRLSPDEALRRIKGLLDEVKTEFAGTISDLSEQWDGNIGYFNLRAKGFSVSGTLTVKPREVELSGNLPFAALPFRGKIESAIRSRAEKLLA